MNQQNLNTPLPKPEPKVFATIDGNSLMAQEYEPLEFTIEKILPHGIFVFAGSPKVGKSWLTLDMCHAISTGGKLRICLADAMLCALCGNCQTPEKK